MRIVQLTRVNVGKPVWVNPDHVLQLEARADRGSLLTMASDGSGIAIKIGVEEEPDDVILRLQG